jgi:hypothetical protein
MHSRLAQYILCFRTAEVGDTYFALLNTGIDHLERVMFDASHENWDRGVCVRLLRRFCLPTLKRVEGWEYSSSFGYATCRSPREYRAVLMGFHLYGTGLQ